MIGRQISHYRIESELGRGGMGVVFLATDTRLDRQVALKFLPPHLSADPEARARFVQEAKAASALDHRSICSVYDIGESDDGRTFMVMPYYRGQTIRERLEAGPMDGGQAREVAGLIADGLEAAHAAGIVHRDIKPANIIITDDGRVKILDFGVAKHGGGEDLTRDGSTVGTAGYMSPEQVRGEEATTASDLWSLGVLLYEMLSGKRPFAGGYEAAVTYAIANQDPDPIPDSVPEDLAGVVAALMEKDPGSRPGSAAEVRDALTTERPVSATNAGRAQQLVPPWMAWAAGVVLVIAAGWFVVNQLRGDRAPEPLHAIAVLPFDIQAGPDLAYLDRGLVSMLSPMIDGIAGYRAVDPKALLGLVDQRDDSYLDPQEGRELAAEFGAARYLMGTLTQVGSGLQLSASLYGSDGSLRKEEHRSIASEEGLPQAAGEILNAMAGDLLEDGNTGLASAVLGTTSSFPALKAWLLGEADYRAGRFEEAFARAEEALAEDSTFAAAWYLAANSLSQQLKPPAYFRRGSYRHADNAPQRLQLLIRARQADTFEERMANYRAIALQYPDDLDALGYIADQIYHRNAYSGLPAADAIPGFEKILRVDPDNGEYLLHLAQLYAVERLDDKLDSLASVVPDQSEQPQSVLIRFSRDLRDPDRRLAAIQGAVPGTFGEAFQAALSSQDVAAVRMLLTALGDFAEDPDFLVAAGYFGLIEGRVEAWSAAFQSQVPGDSLAHLGTSVSVAAEQPHISLPPDSLRSLLRALQAVSPDSDLVLEAVLQSPARYDGDNRDWRVYMSALIAERLGDSALMIDLATELEEADSTHWLTADLAAEIRARGLHLEGKADEAIAVLEATSVHVSNIDGLRSPLADRLHARHARSRILFDLGRYEEAARWARSVHDGFQMHAPLLLPLTLRLEAESYEQLGQWSRAAERYARFVELWAEADPELQPQVEEARRRMEQALERSAGEPD